MFKIENSKFYTEIMGGLVNFFGKDPEATTEAEIHQSLMEAGTIEKVKADAAIEAQKDVKAQLDALQTSVTDMQTQIANLEKGAETAKTELDAVNAKLAEKETEANTAKTELNAANAKIKTLSGEIATLKAGGGKVDQSQTTDDSLEMPKEVAAQFGTVVKGDTLAKTLFGSK